MISFTLDNHDVSGVNHEHLVLLSSYPTACVPAFHTTLNLLQ